jgi:hypothetical protein
MSHVLNLQRLATTAEPIPGNEYLISTFSGICPAGAAEGDQGMSFQQS